MAYNLIPVEREQQFLMPPSLRQWLPQNHLAWFVLDTVESLDLKGFYADRRDDGWGRAAYHPKMMVAVLLYAYATCTRSSRKIERALIEDIAFRVLAANNQPDHATIARFRQRYGQELAELFSQVLSLCVKAGLVDASVVAVDGTKIVADADSTNNLTEEGYQKLAREVLSEAEHIDEEEDSLFGDRRGDELPEHLTDSQRRLEWIKEQLAEIKKVKERAKENHKRSGAPRVNITDPDSRTMLTPSGYVLGYNAQVVADRNQILLAAELSNSAADSPLFATLVDAAGANLEAAGGAAIGTVLADAGYLSLDNVNLDVSCELLIAPAAHSRKNSVEPYDRGEQNRYKTRIQELEMEAELRVGVLNELIAGDLLLKEAAERLGMTIPGVWALKQRYLADGRDGVYRRLPAAPKGPSARQIMAEKLSNDKARRTYDLRSAIVEPVFGHIKWVRALTRFRRRGLEACTTEWKLEAIAHNLLKLWRSSCSSEPCFGF
ncbi:IS1182-like element ISMac1 family transposase [soil metagenome]|jgi:transposase|nr:transposase [Actinomycetota bacterium]